MATVWGAAIATPPSKARPATIKQAHKEVIRRMQPVW